MKHQFLSQYLTFIQNIKKDCIFSSEPGTTPFPPLNLRGVPQPQVHLADGLIIAFMFSLWGYSIYLTYRYSIYLTNRYSIYQTYRYSICLTYMYSIYLRYRYSIYLIYRYSV